MKANHRGNPARAAQDELASLAVRMLDPREALHCALNVALRHDKEVRDVGGELLSEPERYALERAVAVLAKAIEYDDTVVVATATTLTAIEGDGTLVAPGSTDLPHVVRPV